MNFQIEQPKSGGSSCLTWGLILGGLLVVGVIVVPLVCCGGLGYFAYSYISAPLNAITETLEQNQEVADRLGTPIEVSYDKLEIRDFNDNNGTGSGEIEATFKGPEGSARVNAKLDLRNEEWTVRSWEATFPDETVIKGGSEVASASEGTEPEAESGTEEVSP